MKSELMKLTEVLVMKKYKFFDYEAKCEDIRKENESSSIWEAYMNYYPPGSELPIDGPFFVRVDERTQMLVDD